MHDDTHPQDQPDDVWVQLVTRVPLRLHREAKMHSISSDTTLTAFIVSALREKLDRDHDAPSQGAES
jgi:hypothetical protein